VLGIGGAWFEREHDAFDIDFGSGFGERLDRLDESVAIMRRLLDGERFSFEGTHYTIRDAVCEPRPVQAHLPILVGGSGPKKTLRTVALRADAWNTSGTLEEATRNLGILGEHCAAVGRDIAEIELTISFPIVIRDTQAAGRRAIEDMCRHNGIPEIGGVPNLAGPPAAIADELRPYIDLGFRHIMVRMPAPYDRETIDRLPELRAALADVPVKA
jgi:alkanesulfonate monooxygenase SsuD/methylene tetrahydromethanopterin reductase-like flavin-dependent oxidoreductase (luciferase family)